MFASSHLDIHRRAQLHAAGLSHHFGGGALFQDLSVTLHEHTRLAVIGANGTGKSTLLRILAGHLAPWAGRVRVAPVDATVGLIGQRHAVGRGTAVHGDVHSLVAVRTGVHAAQVALEAAEDQLADADEASLEDRTVRHGGALQRWLALGGADLERRVDELLVQVAPGVDGSDPLGRLSGGQWARVELAAVLLARFDVLLLDEPGNDLDLDGTERLRGYLNSRRGPTVIATHDRSLVDSWATEVLELDRGRWYLTQGGLDDHQRARELGLAAELEVWRRDQERRERLRSQADVRRSWAARGRRKAAGERDKYVRAAARGGAERQAGLAAQAAREAGVIAVSRPTSPWRLQLELPGPLAGPELVLSLDEVRHPRLPGPVSASLHHGERLAVVGPNGCGKTTLLALAAGALTATAGRVLAPAAGEIIYLDQHRDALAGGTASVAEIVSGMLPTVTVAGVRSLLAKFGVDAQSAGRGARELSDGLATRVVLAVASARPCRLLVLDEPTNHLDLQARGQLVDALGRWPGTLLLATHDRALLDGLGARVLDLSAGAGP